MKQNTNTEAETAQITDSQADVQQRLRLLLAKFRDVVATRRELAGYWSATGFPDVASSSVRVANLFEICADELERTILNEPDNPTRAGMLFGALEELQSLIADFRAIQDNQPTL